MSEQTAREHKDVDVRKVVFVGIGLLVGLIAVLASMAGLLALFNARDSRPRTIATPEPFAQPQLQINPELDLQTWQATQEAWLHGYGWISEEAGVAHIPIERAMELIVTEGLPTLEPTPLATATAVGPATAAPPPGNANGTP